MAAELFTFDTNLLFYAIDPADAKKRTRALTLLKAADPARAVVCLQSLNELCNAISKRKSTLRHEITGIISLLAELYPIANATLEDTYDALALHDRHHLQYWDALLLATARRSGCGLVLTEDMGDGQTYGGITIRNPFTMSTADFNTLLG